MIRIELDRPLNKVLLSVAALALVLPFLFWIQNDYRAFAASQRLSLEGLQAATRLEPANAEFHDMLGRFYLLVMQDTGKSLAEFEQASRRNPHSSRYWLDLASAHGLAANTDAQRAALQHALIVDPKTPSVAWEAGNFFLLDGNTGAALRSFKTVIEYDPIGMRPALELSWRATHDAKAVLDQAMPPTYAAHLELLRILYEKEQTEQAMVAWQALTAFHDSFKLPDVMPFVEYLIQHRQIADAQQVWPAVARLSPALAPSKSDGNLITNGDFDEEIIQGGFSWRLSPPATKSFELDDREFHSGTASAALTFDGPAFADFGFSQLVPVKPDQQYELLVTAKSQEIVTTDGPRILADDAFTKINLAKGPEWIGTHGWNEERVLFTTKRDTKLVRIYLGRAYGGSLIRGKLWLDNIRMYER
jgi:hypothetical protein